MCCAKADKNRGLRGTDKKGLAHTGPAAQGGENGENGEKEGSSFNDVNTSRAILVNHCSPNSA
jgi:hypothetical protein